MKSRGWIGAFIVGVASAAAQADSPLPPPALNRVLSPSGKFAVISHPTNGTKLIEIASRVTVCEMPGWFRSIYVADDGKSFAIGYGGLNLVPLDIADSSEMLSFWERCRKVSSVPFRAIVPDKSILQRTVSHYAWGNITGFDQSGRLVVARIDGRTLRFNMSTGKAE